MRSCLNHRRWNRCWRRFWIGHLSRSLPASASCHLKEELKGRTHETQSLHRCRMEGFVASVEGLYQLTGEVKGEVCMSYCIHYVAWVLHRHHPHPSSRTCACPMHTLYWNPIGQGISRLADSKRSSEWPGGGMLTTAHHIIFHTAKDIDSPYKMSPDMLCRAIQFSLPIAILRLLRLTSCTISNNVVLDLILELA